MRQTSDGTVTGGVCSMILGRVLDRQARSERVCAQLLKRGEQRVISRGRSASSASAIRSPSIVASS
jgi:hypothetical protein